MLSTPLGFLAAGVRRILVDLAARLGWVCLRLSDFVCVWMGLATGFGWVWLDLAGLGGSE